MDWQRQFMSGGGSFYTGPNGTHPSCMQPNGAIDTICVAELRTYPPPDLLRCGPGAIDWPHLPIPRGGYLYNPIAAHKRTGRCFCASGYFDPMHQTWPPGLMVASMADPYPGYESYGEYPYDAVVNHGIGGAGSTMKYPHGGWSSVGIGVWGDWIEVYWNESADPQPPRPGRPGGDILPGHWRTYNSADGVTWVLDYDDASPTGVLWFAPETIGMYLGVEDNATHSGSCVNGGIEFWIYDDNYPEIVVTTPFDGQDPVNPAGWVEFDVVDGDYSTVVGATTISIAGVPAWSGDAPLAGFSGSRAAIAGGYHYIIYRDTGWASGEEVTVVVHVEDTLSHDDDETWSFTALLDIPTCTWGGGQYGDEEPPFGLCLIPPVPVVPPPPPAPNLGIGAGEMSTMDGPTGLEVPIEVAGPLEDAPAEIVAAIGTLNSEEAMAVLTYTSAAGEVSTIAIDPTLPWTIQSVTLDDVEYLLELSWSPRCSRWYLGLKTADGVDIVSGVAVVVDYPLLSRFGDARLPPGRLIAVSNG